MQGTNPDGIDLRRPGGSVGELLQRWRRTPRVRPRHLRLVPEQRLRRDARGRSGPGLAAHPHRHPGHRGRSLLLSSGPAWPSRGPPQATGMTTTRRNHHGHGVSPTGPDRAEGERAVLRLVGHLRPPAGRQPGRGLPGRRLRRRGQLLRQRRGLLGRRVGADHGRGHRHPGLAPPQLRAVDQALLGHPRRASTCATPSTASTCSRPSTARSSGSASTSSTSSTATGPTPRPRSRRRCGPCPTSSRAGKALYWGTSEWSAEADPGGLGHRRPPPPAQAGGRAAPVQPAVAGPGGAGVRPPLRRHRPGPHHLEPAGLRPADRQVPRRRPRGLPGDPPRLRVAGRAC